MPGSLARYAVLLLLAMAGCSDGGANRARNYPSIKVAEEALRGGSAQIALQVAQGVLTHEPNNVDALLTQGDAQTSLGLLEEASTSYQKALKLQPGSVHGKTGLGRIRLISNPTEAIGLFEDVLRVEPQNVVVMNNLGIANDLLGQHQEAQAVYRKIGVIKPDMVAARINLALSLAMTGQSGEALRLIEPYVNDADATPKIRHDYAAILAMGGKESQAEEVLRRDLSSEEVRVAMQAYRDQRQGGFPSASQAMGPVVAEPALPRVERPASEPPAQMTPVALPAASEAAPHAATGGAGKNSVELGVFLSSDAAQTKWKSLLKKLPDALSGHNFRISQTEQDGKAAWRLLTDGFPDQQAVRSFCEKLHTIKATCHLARGG